MKQVPCPTIGKSTFQAGRADYKELCNS